MREFEQLTNKVISEQLISRVLTEFFRRRLADHGVVLTDTQIEQIRAKVRENPNGPGQMTLDAEQEQVLRAATGQDDFVISIPDDMDDETRGILEGQSKQLLSEIAELYEDYPRRVLEDYFGRLEELTNRFRKEREEFSARLHKTWEYPLRLLQLHIELAIRVGSEFNREVRPAAVEGNDLVFEALTRLHARGCQVASEVLVLLEAGFADGADARWRSLHELTVTAYLLKEHGNDLAERYLLHDVVESYWAAKQYRDDPEKLGPMPISDEEFTQLEHNVSSLVTRFGKDYKNSYGWAAELLGVKKPRFAQLERKAELGHIRPRYKLASHNVHAESKGIYFRLGLFPGSETTILLAGASNAGLADPGHSTALSLTQLTIALLMSRPNSDRVTWCRVFIDLAERIGEFFLEVHNKLQDRSGDEETHTEE